MKKQLNKVLAFMLFTIINFSAFAQPQPVGSTACNVTAQQTYPVNGGTGNILFGSTPLLGSNMELTVTTFEVILANGS